MDDKMNPNQPLVKRQPVALGTIVTAGINIGIAFGLYAMSRENVVLLGASVDVLYPYVQSLVLGVSSWVYVNWLKPKVSPEATTVPMAEELERLRMQLQVLQDRADNPTVSNDKVAADIINLKPVDTEAQKAARRVLKAAA